MAKSNLTHNDLKKKYGEYPCPKCPAGFRKKKMKKGKKRKSLADCKCVKAVLVLGASGYRKAKLAMYRYGKKRKMK